MNQPTIRRDSKAFIAIYFGMGAFILIPLVRWALFETDHQFANIGAAICLLAGFVAWTIAFIRLASPTYRIAGLGLGLCALILGGICFEFRGVTGELVPTFRWRFSSGPDVVLFAGTPSQAPADSPISAEVKSASFLQFLGDSRTGVIMAPGLEMDWKANPPKQLWRIPVGSGWSGICVANGTAWTLFQDEDREAIVAIDLLTGREKYRRSFAGHHFEPLGGTGPRSTPTWFQGKILFQTATGRAVCLDGSSGDLLWQHDLIDLGFENQSQSESEIKWGRSGSPLVVSADRETLAIFPLGGNQARSEARTLIAFDLASGGEIWRSGTHQIAYASPSLFHLGGQDQIVSVNEGAVSGHDPNTGTELWQEAWPSHSNSDACSSQAVQVSRDEILVSKGYGAGAKLIRVKQKDAPVIPPEPSASPLEHGEATSSTGRNAKDSWTVDPIWKNHRVLKTKLTSAVHADGKLYGLNDGILECVEATTGERIWRKGRFGQGQCLIVNDRLLITTEMGKLVLVQQSDGEVLFEQQVLDGVCWNYPAVAGPFVLMRSGTEMVCFYAGKLPLMKSTAGGNRSSVQELANQQMPPARTDEERE